MKFLEKVQSAVHAFHIREQFNLHFRLISIPEVHNVFFERIYFLQKEVTARWEWEALENLREDIEDEIETGRKVLAENAKNRARGIRVPKVFEIVPTERETNYIHGINFHEEYDLYNRILEELLVKSLRAFDYNRTKAARALGISLRTVRNKINEMNINIQEAA